MSDDSHFARSDQNFGLNAANDAISARRANGAWISDVFDILSDEHRRYALYYLRTAPGGEASIDALLEGVSAALADGRDGSHDRVATSLVHSGLPKLADVGLIEYDTRAGLVRFPGDPLVELLLDVTACREFNGW